MQFIVLARHRDLLRQSVLDFTVQPLDVEVHIVPVELLQHLHFRLNVAIDAEECRYLFVLDVHQILIRQVTQKNMAPVRSMICQSIQNALRLLETWLIVGLSVGVAVVLLIRLLLILDELIVAILLDFRAVPHVTI